MVASVHCQCINAYANDDIFMIVDVCAGLTQLAAQTYCETEFGTDLATLDTANVNDGAYNLRIYSSSKSYNAWIGANNIAVESIWMWANENNINYSNWVDDGPNDYGNDTRDCVIMVAYSDEWEVESCMFVTQYMQNMVNNFKCI